MKHTIDTLEIGQTASFEKTISQGDVSLFAGLSGDMNPIHISKVAGESSIFGERVCHGMLVSSLISTVLGTQLPGVGSIYLGQTLQFKAPAHFDDTIKAEVEVISINKQKKIVKLSTRCFNQDNTLLVDGEATILVA